jgi:hypothetical protein
MRFPILKKQHFAVTRIYLIDGRQPRLLYAAPLNFLCFDLLAGRADENELLQARSKFWDRPHVLHGIAARGAY